MGLGGKMDKAERIPAICYFRNLIPNVVILPCWCMLLRTEYIGNFDSELLRDSHLT